MRHVFIYLGAMLIFSACGTEEVEFVDSDVPPDNDGACGEVTEWDVHVVIAVSQNGEPAEGADVSLIEDAWNIPAKTWYGGVTGADGLIEFDAVGIVSVEDCWGIVLSYEAEALKGDRSGAMDMNSSLFGAISDGDFLADVRLFPIELE